MSHLDVEIPLYSGKPHIWIQWKGTNVCCDIHCRCGMRSHFDGDFLYFFRCPGCKQVWEVGTHMVIYPVNEADLDGSIIQEIDADLITTETRVTAVDQVPNELGFNVKLTLACGHIVWVAGYSGPKQAVQSFVPKVGEMVPCIKCGEV